MAMYWTCRYGTNHDLGEKCDCEEAARKERENQEQFIVKETETNQYAFLWPQERAKA